MSSLLSPSASLKVVLAAVTTFAVYKTWKFIKFWTWPLSSPLRDIPGPERENIFFGNLGEIRRNQSSVLHEEWVKKYGKVVVYKGFMNVSLRIYKISAISMTHS